jgi:hypothetical protein
MGVLAANGVRYVVVHEDRLPPQPAVDQDVLAYWQALFGPEASYADDELGVYALPAPPVYAPDPVFGTPLGVAALAARRAWLPGEDVLDVRITWTARQDAIADYACQLVLSGPQGVVASTEIETIAPRYPTSRWPGAVFVADQYVVPLSAGLGAGEYTLEVRVVDVPTGAVRGTTSRQVQVGPEAVPYVPALVEMAAPVGATFGEEMRLLGATWRVEGTQLLVDAYWLALRATDVDYKVFLHLVDPAAGQIVTQLDTMPREWSYPTSRWGRREVFVDRMVLDLSRVVEGDYLLFAGAYEPGGDPLVVRDADGALLSDGRVLLTDDLEVRGQ